MSRLTSCVYLVYLKPDRMLLSRKQYSDWREIQDEYESYLTSVGSFSVEELAGFLSEEYGNDEEKWGFSVEEIRSFMESDTVVKTLTQGAYQVHQRSNQEEGQGINLAPPLFCFYFYPAGETTFRDGREAALCARLTMRPSSRSLFPSLCLRSLFPSLCLRSRFPSRSSYPALPGWWRSPCSSP